MNKYTKIKDPLCQVVCVIDFVGVSLKDLSMQPLSGEQQFLPNLVYSMQPTAIKYVMVNGVTTVKDGNLQSVNEEVLLEKINKTMEYLER